MARYWEWDAPFTIHPEETALLIIDMQTGFTQPDGPLYTPQSAEQLPTIADLKKFCNEKGHPRVYVHLRAGCGFPQRSLLVPQ